MEQENFSEVAKKALEFRRRYYQYLDDPEQRHNIVNLYAPNVPNLCEWNGHLLADHNYVQQYINQLPKTTHQIDTVDAQPLPGNEKADSFIMIVHGIVTYDREHRREFYQRFVIRSINNKYYIINDYYRWLSEKN
ncbi:unnamed protein product [Phytomonas sp. EM1]|nr:unnamed protein product [Phytomonas sp. EM1]|eukprot:CCW61056.1 unnamed protein product [Phytomonas sp. isolate EM1]